MNKEPEPYSETQVQITMKLFLLVIENHGSGELFPSKQLPHKKDNLNL